MKSFLPLFALLCHVTTTAFSQDNKPVKGNWGIGHHINFADSGTPLNINIKHYFSDQWEGGLGLGVVFSSSTNSTFDSIYQPGQYNLKLLVTTTNKYSASTFSVTPFVNRHFKVANNLDFYFGVQVPVSGGTSTKTSLDVSYTGENFFSATNTSTHDPHGFGIGLNGVIGSRFFFYKNLAIGATASLGASGTKTKKPKIQTIQISNSGTSNMDSQNITTTTTTEIKNSSFNLHTASDYNLTLDFYF